MSALAGVWRFDGKPQPDADCARMLGAQEIYGPHDGRQWCEGTLAMGRRLFRLLPEDVHDRQPLQSRDGRLTLVADVRLDNREDLTRALGFTATEAKQLCDAALVLECLDRWSERALDRLVGDFAFALWDAEAQRLLLARDFLGQRPLHYHCGSGFFAFASMPKGLHALAEIPYGPDEQMVAEWLVLMPRHGPRSFFKDIARVEPGHVVTVTRNRVLSRCYWQPQRYGGNRLASSDYVEGLRHHLDQATQSRLRGGDGTVGAHLSAGLDSSAVAATAARLLAPVGGKVIAFTAVPRPGYDSLQLPKNFGDEGSLAGQTAALYPNIEHVLIRSSDRLSLFGGLDRIFHLSQRPMFDPTLYIWFSAVDQAARERKLSVMLVGGMGNMTMSYNGVELLSELLLAGRFIRLWRTGRQLIENGGMSPRGVLILMLGAFMPAQLWQWVEKKTGRRPNNILDYTAIRADSLAERNLATIAHQRALDFAYRPWKDSFAMRLWALRRFELGELYKGTLAGWGVDHRVPLADRRLVEYCLNVPTDEYLFNGQARALARRALADRLSAAVLNERKRGYQAADWHEGVTAARPQLAAELDSLSACAPAAKTLDIEKMKRLVEHWPTSGWNSEGVIDHYRLALLRGISAGHFLRKASGAN
jgi:asparagine synthase (glutamine-hydrolysing)